MPETPYDPLTASFLAAEATAASVRPPDTIGSTEGILDLDSAYSTPGVTVAVTQLRPPDDDAFGLSPKRRKFDGSRVPRTGGNA